MSSKRLILVILSTLFIISSVTIWHTVHVGHEEPWSFYYHLSLELLSDVIIIILFDLIIKDRQRKSETRALLIRDLYSEEQEIRILALDHLLSEGLLSGVILNNIDFRALDLKGRRFERITFFKCNFFGSQLEDAIFIECRLKRTDFSAGNLNESEFQKCVLDSCNFAGSFFTDSAVIDCKFSSCDLSNSRFRRSNVYNTVFEDCPSADMVTDENNIDEVSSRTFPARQIT
jgi:uncharacterized protein YjbI with pentapeptide repeats